MSTSLRELQVAFHDFLLEGTSDFTNLIVARDENMREVRTSIYSDMYRARLYSVLEEDYPVLLSYLDEDDFSDLASQYIETCPAQHVSIRHYSEGFPQFIAEHTVFGELPYLAELAQFEWLLMSTIDSPDGPIVSMETLQSLDESAWPALQFTFHPSVRSRYFHYPVVALYQALVNEVEPPTMLALEKPEHVLFWRNDNLDSRMLVLSVAESWMWEAAQAGDSFATLCEGLCAYMPEEEVPTFAINQVVRWMNEGILSTIQ